MIAIIYILLLMDLSFAAISTSAFCECSEFKTSIECAQQYNCKWSTSCKDKICSDFIEESECDRASDCAWNDTQKKCAQFTSCSNYKVNQASSCQLKDATCIAGDPNPDGSYICQNGTILCSQISDQKLCNSDLYQSQHEMCTYSSSSCQSVDISKCSTITEQFICTSLKCSWSVTNLSCLEGTCSSYSSPDMCSYVSAESIGTKILCKWMDNSCIEANDVFALTSSNCYINTGGSYAWIDGQCKECHSTKFGVLVALNAIFSVLLALML
ncbi:unnamed protein product [Paramecium octaurelia]|uniref:Mini antigen n=1 Tax=Paramecium octaurelia TaxID=43137 RepID=A0A8S1S7R7_PAROT|nr:unnamed protein product [Paramecium octaurelia]